MKGLTFLLCVFPAALAAQQQGGVDLSFTGSAAHEIVQSTLDGSTNRFTGLVLGGEGMLVGNAFVARIRYAQGRVSAKSGTVDPRDVVEGEALIGMRVTPWLTLLAGPRAWAHTSGETDQRWLLWTGRAAARGTLVPGRMQTFVELWGAFAGNSTNPNGKAGGRGANAGLEMRFGALSSFWGRLGYRIESAHMDTRETVEALTLSIIYGFPQ